MMSRSRAAALEELTAVGSVVMLGGGRYLVVTAVPGPEGIRGILTAYEGAGAVWWPSVAPRPERYRLIEGGIPINLASTVSLLLRDFDEVQQAGLLSLVRGTANGSEDPIDGEKT